MSPGRISLTCPATQCTSVMPLTERVSTVPAEEMGGVRAWAGDMARRVMVPRQILLGALAGQRLLRR